MKLDPRKIPPERHGLALIVNLTLVPWVRMDSAPMWGKLLAPVAAVAQVAEWHLHLWKGMVGDVFSGIFLLAVVASLYDWWQGRTLAKSRPAEFSQAAARWGFQSKIANFLQLALMRGLEYWLASADIIATRGFVSAALAMALFAEEMSSMHAARVKAGARPMPLIGAALDWADKISRQLFPVADASAPRRRKEDREITLEMQAVKQPKTPAEAP